VPGGDCDEERADQLIVSSVSKLRMSGHLAVACSFNAFFRNATKKEAAAAVRGGCQVGELGLACATALVGRGSCDGRRSTAVPAQRSWIWRRRLGKARRPPPQRFLFSHPRSCYLQLPVRVMCAGDVG